MPKTANEELHDALIRHQTYLLRYSGYVRNRINDILALTEQDLADKIIARLRNAPGGLNTPVEWRRLQALLNQLTTIRRGAWADATEFMEDELTKLSLAESVTIQGIVTVALPVVIETVQPSARLLRSIALARPFQGRILNEWAAAMEADDLRRMHSAIQLGMTAGESMETIARRVVGTQAFNYEDGTTAMTRRQVQAITRTAVMHIANHARTAWFLENNDVITEEYYVATLDSRTTPICRANDGKVFPLGKGPIPPLHYNCRSLRIARIDGTLAGDRPAKPFTEKQLLGEYAERNRLTGINSRDDLPFGLKGDFDAWKRGRIRQLVGPIPASTTYQQWLKGQSVGFQNDTLGVTKAKLFRNGGLTLDKFVNRNGDELTLAELAKRNRQAFIDAGLDPEDFGP